MATKTANVLARDEMSQNKFDEMMSVGPAQAKNGKSTAAEEVFKNLMEEIGL